MKIRRVEFTHPSGNWSKGFLWWGNKQGCDKGEWVAKTLTEVRQEAMDFVNEISPKRLVGVNEYTTSKNLLGDDKITHIVVWFWEEEILIADNQNSETIVS